MAKLHLYDENNRLPGLDEESGDPTPIVIDNTEESMDDIARQGFGHHVVTLDTAMIIALIRGRAIAWTDGEYTTVLQFHL